MPSNARLSLARIAFKPLALAMATLSLLSLSSPLRAQQTYFTQSGSNYTYPVNQLPFSGNPSSLDFTGNTIQIAGNNSPGSFSALAGALLKADGLSIGYGGTGAVGDVTFSGAGTKVELLGGTVNHLDVGSWGSGTLTVSAGALLDATVNAGGCTGGCSNFIGNGAGSTGTLTVTGVGSEVRTLRNFTVGQSSVFTDPPTTFTLGTPGGTTNAFVNVLAGGTLRTGRVIVGSNNASPNGNGSEKANGTVVVDGIGSQWVVTRNIVDNTAALLSIGIGAGANGLVTVSGGGKLLLDGTGSSGPNDGINIGSSGKGKLTVTGGGSQLLTTGVNTFINVGANNSLGDGSFELLAGATASTLYVNVGRDGGKGVMLIDGVGSTLTQSGVGTVNASNPGAPAFATIGNNGSSGAATVSNGGQWLISDGGGNGSAVGSPGITLGRANSTGSLTITGIGSKVEVVSTSINPVNAADNFNPNIVVGRDSGSTGTLNISAGGKLVMTGNALSTATNVRNTTLNIGGFSNTTLGGTGTATVTGPGSELRVEGVDAFIGVGINGNGALNLSNQALLATTRMNIGRAASGVGALNVDSSFMELNGQWTSDGTNAGFTVGSRGGNGTATIANNSLVTITNMGSNGPNISLGGTSPNPLGHGELTVSGGSKINLIGAPGLASMNVGRDGSGIATITGIGSQIDLGDGTLNVAQLATSTGTLTINGGGKVLAGVANIGGSSTTVAGGNGTAAVSGAGSELRVAGPAAFIGVGRGGVGSLDVSNGGTVSSTAMTIGRYSGGQGTLTVNNSLVELSGQQTAGNLVGANLAIGNGGGIGGATITNASTVNITNYTAAGNVGANLFIGGSGNYPLGNGSLVLSGGSQINVLAAPGAASAPTLGGVTIGNDGTGTASLSGGSSINVGAGNVYVARQAGSTGTLVMNSNSTINAGFVGIGVGSAGVGNALGAAGGTATLTLNDSTINTSRFELGVNGLLTGNNGVINVADSVNPVNGLPVKGPVVIGGTISPGTSPGRLRINCDLTMLSGSKLILEIDDNGASFDIDQLIIGNESKFDLYSLQIIFSFIGNTNPNEFAASEGGFNLDKFLLAGGSGNTVSGGLSSLFGNAQNPNTKNWNQAVNSQIFAFESSAYDVTNWSMGPGGVVNIEANAIPEPASIALVLLALATMLTLTLSRRGAARRL